MQLHPNDPTKALSHTAQSVAAGFVGLDFMNPPGDLTDVSSADIDESQRGYWKFAHNMKIGDLVLIIAHHYPYALVRVSGEYNYIRTPVGDLGVWFRHFRSVDQVWYYGDFVTNAKKWERIIMAETISPLKDSTTTQFRLVKKWIAHMAK
jgi:hypothetical protein